MNNMEKFLTLLDGEVDGLLLTSRYSRHYCAEFDIAEGVAIVSKAGCRYFTDSRYIESAQNGLKGFEVLDVAGHGYFKRINDAIADFGITSLGFEENYLTVAEYNGYVAHLNAKLEPMNARIHAFRATKEDWELDRMRKAQEITDKSFTEVLTKIKVGMTEKELSAELICCLLKNGVRKVEDITEELLLKAMNFGTVAGWLCVQKKGAMESLPTYAEVEAILEA